MRKNIKFKFLGVNFDIITKHEALEKIDRFFQKNGESLITTTNVELLMNSTQDDDFRGILSNKSSLNLIDGSGIVWGIGLMHSWKPNIIIIKQIYITIQWFISILLMPLSLLIFKKVVPSKISGSDFAWDLARYAARKNKNLFLLGYKHGIDPDSARKASLKLITDIYNLKIVGTHSGTDSITEESKTINLIKNSSADILMVGFGSPKQEKWLARNLKKTNSKIGIGLGGTFDFIAGIQKRSPKWAQALGFEWLFRLFQNPRRINRQINTIPSYLFKVLLEKYKS